MGQEDACSQSKFKLIVIDLTFWQIYDEIVIMTAVDRASLSYCSVNLNQAQIRYFYWPL